MKYKLCIGPYGAECVVGVIPDKIWKYIEKECDGNASTYSEKLNDGEVPEEFMLAEDVGSFYEPAACVEVLYQNNAAEASTCYFLLDEEDNEIRKGFATDLDVVDGERKEQPEGKHIFVWKSVEKHYYWIVAKFEADEFEPDMVEATVDTVVAKDGTEFTFMTMLNYDGEFFETDCSESRGMGYELYFF